ncbi:hypothetical protein B0H14DRAFT_3163300 [Mycena olivaceomarginata]|nr:hypothetical protein B0H14DRAFT_3163300 [Mycena olivaceomarginata]
MRNHYVSLLLSASNLWAAAQAGPPLDARQQTSSEGSSPSSSPSMSSLSSSPSSPVILGNYASSSVLQGRSVVLAPGGTDGPFLTCNASLTSISFDLGIFNFTAGCQSIFSVLDHLTEYRDFNNSKFYEINPEIDPGCEHMRDQTDYCLSKLDSDADTLDIQYASVPSDPNLQNTNNTCSVYLLSEIDDSCDKLGRAYKFSNDQFSFLNDGRSCDDPITSQSEYVCVRPVNITVYPPNMSAFRAGS